MFQFVARWLLVALVLYGVLAFVFWVVREPAKKEEEKQPEGNK